MSDNSISSALVNYVLTKFCTMHLLNFAKQSAHLRSQQKADTDQQQQGAEAADV